MNDDLGTEDTQANLPILTKNRKLNIYSNLINEFFRCYFFFQIIIIDETYH